jgi:hypothetical protein
MMDLPDVTVHNHAVSRQQAVHEDCEMESGSAHCAMSRCVRAAGRHSVWFILSTRTPQPLCAGTLNKVKISSKGAVQLHRDMKVTRDTTLGLSVSVNAIDMTQQPDVGVSVDYTP